jgi:hypothetical protein
MVRGDLSGYSAVRTHRDACEGRADDADVAVRLQDTHEPAGSAGAIRGLHTASGESSR